jgi:hypothetical protein
VCHHRRDGDGLVDPDEQVEGAGAVAADDEVIGEGGQLLQPRAPRLRGTNIIDGVGHLVQPQAAERVSGLLIEFLKGL